MGAVFAIAANTFREAVRRRVFLLVLVLTAAVVAVMVILPYFAFKQETDMFKDLALSTAMLATVFLVALVGSGAVAEELETHTATTVLAKPVSRRQFLLGKYLGVVLALLVAAALLAALLFLATYLRVYFDAPARERHLAFSIPDSAPAREFQARMLGHALATLPGAVMIFYEGAVLAALAVVFSSRFSRVVAVVVTFGVFLVGHLSEFVLVGVRQSAHAVRTAADVLVHLLPYLETFNITSKVSHMSVGPGHPEFAAVWSYTAWAGLYAVGYAAFVLLLGVLLLRGREIA